MWVFDRWSPYSYQNNREKYKDDEEKREFNLKECLWFCMTSLTPQVNKSLSAYTDTEGKVKIQFVTETGGEKSRTV